MSTEDRRKLLEAEGRGVDLESGGDLPAGSFFVLDGVEDAHAKIVRQGLSGAILDWVCRLTGMETRVPCPTDHQVSPSLYVWISGLWGEFSHGPSSDLERATTAM